MIPGFRHIPFVAVAFAASLHPAFGQFVQPKFGRITIDDGLSSFRVYDILQDTRGFMWIATMDGLNRYDGNTFKVYKHKEDDTTSMSGSIITALCEDRQGMIWVGTRDGFLNRYDRITDRFTRYVHDPTDSTTVNGFPISALYQAGSDDIWMATLGGGISRFDPLLAGRDRPVFHHFTHDKTTRNTLGSNTVYAIAGNEKQTLLIATSGGLSTFDGKDFTSFRHDPLDSNSLCDDLVVGVYADQSGGIWAATRGGVSYSRDPVSGFVNFQHDKHDPQTLSYPFATSMYPRNDRYMWIGTQMGLNKLDRVTGIVNRYLHNPSDPNGPVNNYIIKIRPDNAGNIWVATDRGLGKIIARTSQFVHYTHDADPLMSQTVSSLHGDQRGSLWVGTDAGVKTFDGSGKLIAYYRNESRNPGTVGPGYVQAIIEDRSASIWVGTLGGGLNRFDRKASRFDHFGWGPHGALNQVMSLCDDPRGMLWVGTRGDGLLRFNKETHEFQHYVHDDEQPRSLSNNMVHAILVDRDSNLWVGTEGGGLCMLAAREVIPGRPAVFTSYKHDSKNKRSLSNDRVYALYEDRMKQLWVATGNGLNLFERESRTFKRHGNMFPGTVLGIQEDTHGNLWLATVQDGIYRFNPATGQSENFDADDGLQSNRFTYASFKRPDGTMFFGGEKGYTVFHPESIKTNAHSPGTVITDFRVYDKPLALDTLISEIRELSLAHDQNYFSFEFSCLDFTMPGKNSYTYMLEGFDDGWINAGGRRYASYTNIDPGEYVFRVRSANSDMVWDPRGTSVSLVILPPYWQTWWFRTLAAALIACLTAILYRYRIESLLRVERIRAGIASDLHDDIGSNLGSIALTSDIIRSSTGLGEKEKEQLLEVSARARSTAERLRDAVWVISPSHDKLENLILKLKDEAAGMLKGIPFTFQSDCPREYMNTLLDISFSRNILLVYKEVLHNVLKHSGATSVRITLEVQNRMLRLQVRDNGRGFDTGMTHHGSGLTSIRNRVSKIKGAVEISSSSGEGVLIAVSAKIP